MTKKIYTLIFVHKAKQILLGMKKRGFGQGKWNGFGGKLEEGETIEESAIREMYEESGLQVSDLKQIGINRFYYTEGDKLMETYVFVTDTFTGDPTESEETLPKWFDIDKLPYDSMWPDDKFWMPYLLDGKIFEAEFTFDPNNNLLSHKITEVNN